MRGSSRRVLATAGIAMALAGPAGASRCDPEVSAVAVSGVDECLAMTRFGASTLPPGGALVVWLHGDVSSGGPASYHAAYASKLVADDTSGRLASIALVRPGYPADDGRSSSGDAHGRNDHYTRANVAEVAGALERLRTSTGASRLVVVGHSGGAATAALVAASRPGLVDAMVLVACPCDIVAWRSGRRAWTRSENPLAWADRVPVTTKVVALTGSRDDNTSPALASAYVAALKARGVDARFESVEGETHNGVMRSDEVMRAVRALAAPAP